VAGEPSQSSDGTAHDGDQPIDAIEVYRAQAIKLVAEDAALRANLATAKGTPWMGVQAAVVERLPSALSDRDQIAYQLVPKVLDAMLGDGNWETHKLPKKNDPNRMTTWVRKKAQA
jgi:hypothetical protein